MVDTSTLATDRDAAVMRWNDLEATNKAQKAEIDELRREIERLRAKNAQLCDHKLDKANKALVDASKSMMNMAKEIQVVNSANRIVKIAEDRASRAEVEKRELVVQLAAAQRRIDSQGAAVNAKLQAAHDASKERVDTLVIG